jgi:hypothetical protein
MSILIGLAHEPVFNAAMATQVVFQQPVSRDELLSMLARGLPSTDGANDPLRNVLL